jgi:hypothetical protein
MSQSSISLDLTDNYGYIQLNATSTGPRMHRTGLALMLSAFDVDLDANARVTLPQVHQVSEDGSSIMCALCFGQCSQAARSSTPEPTPRTRFGSAPMWLRTFISFPIHKEWRQKSHV